MKIKLFKIKKDYQKENFKINLDFYWRGIIIFSLLSVIASFAFAYNIFTEINKEDSSMIEKDNIKIGDKEKEKIRDILEYFAEREKKSIEILNSKTSIIDPSL